MPTYRVVFQVFGSAWLDVEAASEAEAQAKAEASFMVPSLCNQCAAKCALGDDLGEVIEIEELDE